MNDDGGPAFPLALEGARVPGDYGLNMGMSLRDYFAAAAMQGMLADPNVNDIDGFLADGVKQCYEVADAMLAERDK